MRALSHVFIRVHHEARDINLLLVTSKKRSSSEERIRAKINVKLFCIRFNLCEYVCETWCAAVLTVTHLNTSLNDDIYELLHVEIAEQCRNKAPSLLLFFFLVEASKGKKEGMRRIASWTERLSRKTQTQKTLHVLESPECFPSSAVGCFTSTNYCGWGLSGDTEESLMSEI